MLSIGKKTVDKEQAGTWVEYDGSQLLIASTNNHRFQREYSRMQQPYRRKIERGNLDPEIMKDIICTCAGAYLLIDWKKVVDEDGKPVSYDPKVAKRVLMQNSELRDFVLEFSSDVANYVEEETREVGESSPTTSNG